MRNIYKIKSTCMLCSRHSSQTFANSVGRKLIIWLGFRLATLSDYPHQSPIIIYYHRKIWMHGVIQSAYIDIVNVHNNILIIIIIIIIIFYSLGQKILILINVYKR